MIDRRRLLHTSAASMAALALPASARAEEGRFISGDVTIFYRRFGKPGKTPVVLMHGANYFDSFDWINVADKLAVDREVVCFDMRGFGESSWSPSKNYSIDALLGDIRAVVAHLGWRKPIIAGHSFSQDRARAEQALTKVAQGYQLKRDPDYSNAKPIDPSVNVRPVRELDVWAELPKVGTSLYFVRGLKSNRFTPEIVARLNRDFPKIVWATANSMHDIPFYAPDELIAALKSFTQDI